MVISLGNKMIVKETQIHVIWGQKHNLLPNYLFGIPLGDSPGEYLDTECETKEAAQHFCLTKCDEKVMKVKCINEESV